MSKKNISSILRKGSSISTRIGLGIKWQENTVHKSTDDSITTYLLKSYVDNAILPGEKFYLKYSDGYYEYLFDGVVSNVSANSPGYIDINISNYEKHVNARNFKRYNIFIPSNIKSVTEKTSFFSIITNISMSGLSIITNHKLQKNTETEILLKLSNSNNLNLMGKITRICKKNNIIEYGLEFSKVDKQTKKKLLNYLVALEEDQQP